MKQSEWNSRFEELSRKSSFLIHATGRILAQLDDAVPDKKTALGGQILLYELQEELDKLSKSVEGESIPGSGNDGG